VPSPPLASAVALQRMIGNRATSSLLAGHLSPPGVRQVARQPVTKPDPQAAKKAALDGLAKKKKWKELAAALAGFSDAEMPSWIPALGDAFADFMTYLLQNPSAGNDRVFARATYADFQRQHPRVNPSENEIVLKEGKASKAVSVGGGEVTVRTGETHATKHDLGNPEDRKKFGYSVSYKGKDSEHSRWLQFVWIEALAERPGGPPGGTPLPFDVPAAGLPMKSTTDHGNPDVTVDAGGTTPFYEDGGANNRTADSTTIFDNPTSQSSAWDHVFKEASPPTRVTAIAHMIQYLVRDDQVLCRVNLEAKWVFTDATVPTPTFTVPRLKAVSELNPDHHRRLKAQFPGFTWIP
jgi:hypothetical protein